MALKISKRALDADKHSYDVNTLLYHKGNLYSAADDGKIMIWDKDLKKKYEIEAHPSTVYSLAAINDTLYSCSNDGAIKSWTLDLKPKSIVVKDDCEYWKLAVYDKVLFAGSDQGIIYAYEDEVLKYQIEILEGIKDMVVKDKFIFSAKDIDVAITELLDGPKAHEVRRKTIPGRSPLCLVDDKLIVTGGLAKDFAVHENSNKLFYETVAEIKDAHEMIINSIVALKINEDIHIYSAGWDKIVKHWKLSGKSLQMVTSCCTDVVVNTMVLGDLGQIYAAGGDGHIIRLDF